MDEIEFVFLHPVIFGVVNDEFYVRRDAGGNSRDNFYASRHKKRPCLANQGLDQYLGPGIRDADQWNPMAQIP